MKYKRCVPVGRARKELYQMSMEWNRTFCEWFAALMNLSYSTSSTLGTWEQAEAAQLDKHNGKAGAQGIRIICMMDAMGNIYYSQLNKLTNDTKHDFGYGFYSFRRREQANLVHHGITNRLIAAGRTSTGNTKHDFSFVTTYRDI